MLRRTIRERREYLYRKNLEAKERVLYDKKRKIREAIAGIRLAFATVLIRSCSPPPPPSSLTLSDRVLFLVCSVDEAEEKPIPTELRNEEAELRKEIDLEDEQTAGVFVFPLPPFKNVRKLCFCSAREHFCVFILVD